MAEKIIQFKAKKEIFDNGKTKSEWVQMGAEVAKTRLACSICKCVPWYNPNYDWARDVKIFQTGEGDVLCSICKPKFKLPGIFRSSSLEDLLKSLSIPCKYNKNKCQTVDHDPKNLAYHEEDCEYRDVSCYYDFCEERIPAKKFKKHCREKHELNLECPLGHDGNGGHVCRFDHLVQFKGQKEKYDKIAPRLVCSNCKVAPILSWDIGYWRPPLIRNTGNCQIFQTGQGDVLCSICKQKSKLPGISRSSILEDLLRSLPDPCQYQKNGCPVVLGKGEIEILCDHETECKFQDVLCSYGYCEERVLASEFKKHCLETHELDFETDTAEVSENGVCILIDEVEKKCFDLEWCSNTNKVIRFNDSKSFLFHINSQNGSNFFWLQLIGSEFEAMDFEYSLKVEVSPHGASHIGKFYYEGDVRSLDDDKNELFETGLGLVIFNGALKKLVQSQDIHISKKRRRLMGKLILGEYYIEVTIKEKQRNANVIINGDSMSEDD